MKQILIFLFLLFFSLQVFPQYSVYGGIGEPYDLKAKENISPNGGVENIYLLNTLNNAYIIYNITEKPVVFYKYKRGMEDEIEIPATSDGNSTYQINNLEDETGYYAKIGGKDGSIKYPIWIIDYNQHRSLLEVMTPTPFSESNCRENIKLNVNKSDSKLNYFWSSIPYTISKKYELEYENLQWKEENKEFITIVEKKEINDILQGNNLEITVNPVPLKDTYFTLAGDQFAKHFGMDGTQVSCEYNAAAVEAHIESRIIIDGMESDTASIETATSAPLQVRFYGYANDPTAVYYTWYIYHDKRGEEYIDRYFMEKDITYTFTQAGTYRIKLEAANNNSTCIAETEVSLNISESELKIPNFFSPDASPGVNDIFKVKHKSLIKFKGTIFNRWGNKLFEWSDPDEGWDGKYKGKFVSPGVYFYVIEATGSDGIKYKKGGDINILRGR